MTECFSARCQQDKKLARREFNKWTKNILLQIGLETIAKNHFDFNVDIFETNDKEEKTTIEDFDPKETCLFCVNRQEMIGNRKLVQRPIDFVSSTPNLLSFDDDENAPLDLSIKSTNNNSSNLNRNSVKHRPLFEVKSDIPGMCNQDDFDRLMTNFITGQMGQNLDVNEMKRKYSTNDFSSNPYFGTNIFSNPSINYSTCPTTLNPRNISPTTQETRIGQLAKQMAFERMMQEIDYQRHPQTKKSLFTMPASSVLTESFHVNHILNDVMMRLLQEMFVKNSTLPTATTTTNSQTRVSRQGELLFVKKQNQNNDEQILNGNSSKEKMSKIKTTNPSSSSSSSTSSESSSPSISTHSKVKHKSTRSSTNRTLSRNVGRQAEILSNNGKVLIGQDGKQIRPKRGQYRRYESEQLAKAVAAVLSNEMSVHKAGSYFGVPHSTLEYKVKERNTKTSSNNIKSKSDNLLVEPETMNSGQTSSISSLLSVIDHEERDKNKDENRVIFDNDNDSSVVSEPMDSSPAIKSVEN